MRKIEFIEYTGKYPNLCSGVLTVLIDGQEYKFGHDYGSFLISKHEFPKEDPNKPNYPEFWETGGSVWFDDDWNDYISKGPWEYNGDLKDYSEFTEEDISELLRIFNENVKFGCCGGCV